MRRVAWLACIVLLAPTALAADTLSADSFQLSGSVSVESDIAALFAMMRNDGVTWDATAASGTLERLYSTYRAVDNPTNPQAYYASYASEWMTDSTDFAELQIVSTGSLEGAAMLALGSEAIVDAHSEGLVAIRPVQDPRVEQDIPAQMQSQDAKMFIAETVEGQFLEIAFSDGSYVLRGDLTLILFGPSYELTAQGTTHEMRTGQYETERAAIYAEGREERHLLRLTDATLTVRALEPITIFTTYPTIDLSGTIQAPRPEGALDVGGAVITPPADGSELVWTGAATLALANDGGRVAAASPLVALGSSGAVVPQGPPIVPAIVGTIVLAALVAGAVALARSRRDRAGDMELALLAMEERRWNDALPHLNRITKKRPDDASAQIDRALCLEQIGRFDEAARAFEAALRAAPKHAEAHFYYARTLAKMRETEAARVHLETALEGDPRLVEMARGERVLRGL